MMLSFATVDTTKSYYFQYFVMAYAVGLLFRKLKQCTKVMVALSAYMYCNHSNDGTLFHIYIPIVREERLTQNDIHQIVAYLEEKELDTAHPTVYFADTITILSNGKVRVADVASVSHIGICRWMTLCYLKNR
ncbi:MAG: hypothetical protein NC231_11980 [Bacillus sp. (in: Bacteria)]|nr:hypothetical protein [Bacillus sp. (in: firmicutes)]MCM1427000.1 hypothetical protein [Eubacterium sp.]